MCKQIFYIYIYIIKIVYISRYVLLVRDKKNHFVHYFFSFIGELFNRHVIHPKIMQYCIEYLICQRSEGPIECLCNLLRTSGKELERVRIYTFKKKIIPCFGFITML